MPPPIRDLRGALIDNRFRVASRLGDGGAGSVWSVQHVQSLQRFALKTLHDEYASDPAVLARFLREARAAASLRSKHVVRIIDAQMDYVHEGEPLPFLVMELLEGATLDRALAAGARATPGQTCWVANQLGAALRMSHESGIVHRDLKPANVFVTTDEEGQPLVKLCDFGIAKLLRTAPFATDGATRTGAVLGTPMYMAPEQLRAAKDGGPEIDQWALGLTVFRMLAGFEYFGRAGTGAELIAAILSDPLPAPSGLDASLTKAFDAWFLRSCNRDPAARWPDTAAQTEALHVAGGRPPPEPPHAGPASDRPRSIPTRATAARTPVRLAIKTNWVIAFATVGMLGVMWRMRTYADLHGTKPGTLDAAVMPDPSNRTLVLESARPAVSESLTARPADPPTAEDPSPNRQRRQQASDGTRTHRNDVPQSVRPGAPPVQSVVPQPVPVPARLPQGAGCSRSSQCSSGLCVAEVCQ